MPMLDTFICLGVNADLSHLPESMMFRLEQPITCGGLEVQVIALPPGDDVLVAGFANGLTLGDAAALAASAHADFDLTTPLALLLRHGALCSLN